MGIDLSGIIKNDFRERKHRRACEDYVNATINLLTDKYHISNDTFRLEYESYKDSFDISIETDMWDIMRLQLCDGMWHVELGVHYCQVFFKNQYWRLLLQEIADALGQKEFWICDENCTWNSPYIPHDIGETSFEEWYSCIASGIEGCDNGIIPEYPMDEIMSTPHDKSFYPYLKAYHDTTNLYLAMKKRVSDKIKERELISLNGVGLGFYPVLIKDKLYLINPDRDKIIGNGPIETYECSLNSAGYVIVKDGKNYLVDDNGDIRSEGTSEHFQWEWDSDKEFPYPAFILISNPALPNKWRVDIRTGVMTEI